MGPVAGSSGLAGKLAAALALRHVVAAGVERVAVIVWERRRLDQRWRHGRPRREVSHFPRVRFHESHGV